MNGKYYSFDDEAGDQFVARLATATGYSEPQVISNALALYDRMLQARFRGKAVGVAASKDDLETQFITLFMGDVGQEPAKAEPEPEPKSSSEPEFKVGDLVTLSETASEERRGKNLRGFVSEIGEQVGYTVAVMWVGDRATPYYNAAIRQNYNPSELVHAEV